MALIWFASRTIKIQLSVLPKTHGIVSVARGTRDLVFACMFSKKFIYCFALVTIRYMSLRSNTYIRYFKGSAHLFIRTKFFEPICLLSIGHRSHVVGLTVSPKDDLVLSGALVYVRCVANDYFAKPDWTMFDCGICVRPLVLVSGNLSLYS